MVKAEVTIVTDAQNKDPTNLATETQLAPSTDFLAEAPRRQPQVSVSVKLSLKDALLASAKADSLAPNFHPGPLSMWTGRGAVKTEVTIATAAPKLASDPKMPLG